MKNLKNQLLAIFSAFIFVNLLTVVCTAYYFKEKETLALQKEKVSSIEIDLLNAIREQENFFNFELVNPFYYETRESNFIAKYQAKFLSLKNNLNQLAKSDSDTFQRERRAAISQNLDDFDHIFFQTISAINKRGFKNYGIEGKMRVAIHQLEKYSELNIVDILMLRRHEKDYINRLDPIYVEKHSKLGGKVKQQILGTFNERDEEVNAMVNVLDEYLSSFNQIVLLDRMIGLKMNTGFKHQLNQLSNELLIQLEELKVHSIANSEKSVFKLNILIFLVWSIYIAGSIFMSLVISKRFTKRIKLLSSGINYFVNSNFTARLNLVRSPRKDEVGKLWNNFIRMEQEIIDYLELFKEKVDEKTVELHNKTQKIENQHRELTIQKEESERKNKDLLDGIRYGWRIQRALIPTAKRFNKHVENGFVFFTPKDIVSGDIYWTEKQKNDVIISAIDCTGHGVPGAFMSILAINALNYAVLNKGIDSPAKILKTCNDYVFDTMKYYNSHQLDYHTRDGIDMLLCKLNRRNMELQYAGANRPLYLVRSIVSEESENIGLATEDYKLNQYKNELIFEVKPTKKTVGTIASEDSNIFDLKKVQLQKNDMVYLTTDGYADQFGGERSKKFMISRLKNLMVLVHHLTAEDQKKAIESAFLDWKNEEEQVDDITIIGIRI